ncbi:stage III sporulation protein AF [Hathewaya massiliensis]|uniref:stage III sporulation protein AF n=1 Tax=Hathewaya massiliensis TaxID=1964382 RepID=UPI00115B510A|nr:stage III sporulation protein AF [Hathewaya massiliensis]
MMEMIKSWIINLCTIMIFITAVEMILPDNSIKKYAKYVLSLLIVLAMLTPILKIMTKGFNPSEVSKKADKYFEAQAYEKDMNKYKKKNIERTVEGFKEKLALECKESLNKSLKKEKFKVEIDADFNEKQRKIEINEIRVGFSEGSISKIKPVNIGKDKEVEKQRGDSSDERINMIKNVIEKEFGIKREKILVYNLDK